MYKSSPVLILTIAGTSRLSVLKTPVSPSSSKRARLHIAAGPVYSPWDE